MSDSGSERFEVQVGPWRNWRVEEQAGSPYWWWRWIEESSGCLVEAVMRVPGVMLVVLVDPFLGEESH